MLSVVGGYGCVGVGVVGDVGMWWGVADRVVGVGGIGVVAIVGIVVDAIVVSYVDVGVCDGVCGGVCVGCDVVGVEITVVGVRGSVGSTRIDIMPVVMITLTLCITELNTPAYARTTTITETSAYSNK